MKKILIIPALLLAMTSFSQKAIDEVDVCISQEEQELYDLVMEYRASKGLPEIPLSISLTYVAQQHAKDLAINQPSGGECNMHSWSEQGSWTGCCYTSDHAKAGCMWNKPKELTNYPYTGFEIACMASGDLTAAQALDIWQDSSPHNAVMVNEGIWADPWEAIGIAIYEDYSVIWFGNAEDPAGTVYICD